MLIATFVLAVGLMGLAALLPVSRDQMVKAGNADRSSALARAALKDLQVRGYLDARRWMTIAPGPTPGWALTTGEPYTDLNGNGVYDFGEPYTDLNGNGVYDVGAVFAAPMVPPVIIDPLVLAFPINLNPPGPPTQFPVNTLGVPGTPPLIMRVTIDTAGSYPMLASARPMSYLLAERIFMSNDDQVFSKPKTAGERPHQWAPGQGAWGQPGVDDDGNGIIDDDAERGWGWGTNAPWADFPDPQFAGDYSWIVSISPALGEFLTGAGSLRQYVVSVVVFYKRDLAGAMGVASPQAPPERMVLADFPAAGTAYGGGSVNLRAHAPQGAGQAGPSTPAEAQNWLAVKPNQWIMLSGSLINNTPNPFPPPATLPDRPMIAWYRVSGVDSEVVGPAGGPWTRYVTLAGPDWPVASTRTGATVYATLLDGAVAVYEKTITLEGVSLW